MFFFAAVALVLTKTDDTRLNSLVDEVNVRISRHFCCWSLFKPLCLCLASGSVVFYSENITANPFVLSYDCDPGLGGGEEGVRDDLSKIQNDGVFFTIKYKHRIF